MYSIKYLILVNGKSSTDTEKQQYRTSRT